MALEIELWDIGLWSAISALLLLITSEVISPYYGRNNILLRSKNIRHIGIGIGLFFLIIAIIRIITIL
ncbi:MAG: hypothetical protein KatS3mg003_0654 [Candidatus Nitrosocaldaceae archaeon]|nr:MAG: hypothetical protein KatS3mg003_0654 [Candidatus Nitrosocaldaceae archaeon]